MISKKSSRFSSNLLALGISTAYFPASGIHYTNENPKNLQNVDILYYLVDESIK